MKLYLMIFLIIIPFSPAQVRINEIMYRPDAGNEWIELYYTGAEPFSLANLTIEDNYASDELACCPFPAACPLVMQNNSYLVILEQDGDHNLSDELLCVDDQSIGNGLGNTRDSILLLQNSTLLTSVSYNSTIPKGRSLAWYNGTWTTSMPTPGYMNEKYDGKDMLLEIVVGSSIFSGASPKLFRVTNLDHRIGIKDNLSATLFFNVTTQNSTRKKNLTVDVNSQSMAAAYTFLESGNYTVCGIVMFQDDSNPLNNQVCHDLEVIDAAYVSCNVSLTIDLDDFIYNNSEKIAFKPRISNATFSFEIKYWIEDLQGLIQKSPITSSNTNTKYYTPSTDELDRVLIIKANLTKIGCNDSDKSDNFADEIVLIKNQKPLSSSLRIEKVYLGSDGMARFGDTLRVKIRVYKGNETKTSVRAWVEGDGTVSKSTSFNLYYQFREHELTIPLQLKPNCRETYQNGYYQVVVEGLEQRATYALKIEGRTASLCKTGSSNSVTMKKEQRESFELIDYTPFTFTGEISAQIKITNPDKKTHTYAVWSYIFRGPKSYSGNRDQNKQVYRVKSGDAVAITLHNRVEEYEQGTYKLKIKILKDHLITTHDITREVALLPPQKRIEQEKKQARIASFYTRTRSSVEQVNLYARISEMKENLSLILISIDGAKQIPLHDDKANFSVHLYEGDNPFFLKLMHEDAILDIGELHLERNRTDGENIHSLNQQFPIKDTKIPLGSERLTGEVVYQSPDEKAKNMIPLLILISLGLLLGALYKQMQHPKTI